MKKNLDMSIGFAVAQREDGKFIFLEIDYATTSPHWVDHPYYATKVFPFDPGRLDPAPHYFENSWRMRMWLDGCKMVWVRLDCTATIGIEETPSDYIHNWKDEKGFEI